MTNPMTIEEAECAFARLSKYVRGKTGGIQGGGGPVEHPNQGLLDDIRDLRQALTTLLAYAKARDEEVKRAHGWGYATGYGQASNHKAADEEGAWESYRTTLGGNP